MRNTVLLKVGDGRSPTDQHQQIYQPSSGSSKQDPHCSLCETRFPAASLPGSVPFNAVAEWRAARGAPFHPEDQRLGVHHRYEPAPLCSFCMQFFDKNFVDYLDYRKGEASRKDPVFDVEDTAHNLAAVHGGDRGDASVERALSPMVQQVSLLHLRSMKDKPLLMEQVGCQLAKWSNHKPEFGKRGRRHVRTRSTHAARPRKLGGSYSLPPLSNRGPQGETVKVGGATRRIAQTRRPTKKGHIPPLLQTSEPRGPSKSKRPHSLSRLEGPSWARSPPP